MMESAMITQELSVIEPSYRRNFILKVCCVFLLIIVVCAAVFYAYFDRTFDNSYVGALATLEGLSREMCHGIIFSVLVQVFFLTLLVFFISIVWTHKIAGPLYRLRLAFQQVAAGNLSVAIRFRNTDQLQNIPVLFNSGLEQLKGDFEQLHREIAGIKVEIDQLTEECCQQDGCESMSRYKESEERLHQVLKLITK
jgi:methyl-accepting chemotaxis protein